MPVSPRTLLSWLTVLLCACSVGRPAPPPPPPAPPPLPPPVVDLELVSGERRTVPLNLENSNCEGAITYTVSTDAPWVDLPEPAKVSGLASAQQRLVALGCFAATGEPAETEGIYGTATHEAVVAFQLANHFDRPRLDLPFLGQLRPRQEWRLLKRPFPRLDGPRRCGEVA